MMYLRFRVYSPKRHAHIANPDWKIQWFQTDRINQFNRLTIQDQDTLQPIHHYLKGYTSTPRPFPGSTPPLPTDFDTDHQDLHQPIVKPI